MPSREKVVMPTLIDIGTLITRSPDVCGDRPRVTGTRFSVQQAAVLTKEGLTVEEIVKEYDSLTIAQVHAALAYYHANQSEIEAYLAEEEAEYERLLSQQNLGTSS
jgi:uncharacterized protein (DUF433 family)